MNFKLAVLVAAMICVASCTAQANMPDYGVGRRLHENWGAASVTRSFTQEQADSLLGVWAENGTQSFFSTQLASAIMAKQFRDTGKVHAGKAFKEAQDFSNIGQIMPPQTVKFEPRKPNIRFVIYGADALAHLWGGAVIFDDGTKVKEVHPVEGFVYPTDYDGNGKTAPTFQGSTADGSVELWGILGAGDMLELMVNNREGRRGGHFDAVYVASGAYSRTTQSVNELLTQAASDLGADFSGKPQHAAGAPPARK